MKDKDLKFEPTKTVLIITVGFLMVYLVLWKRSGEQHEWLLYVAAFVGLGGFLSGFVASKINWLWMKLTWVLSMIVPNVLMSLVFYLVLSPFALFSRIIGKKDPLHLKNPNDTVFKVNEKQFDQKSFENPW
ncbi:MAG: hypothetical protein HEP71_14265 [Roseivirga sp.]|nr:hypothetical protein [Roseivirga sp.]